MAENAKNLSVPLPEVNLNPVQLTILISLMVKNAMAALTGLPYLMITGSRLTVIPAILRLLTLLELNANATIPDSKTLGKILLCPKPVSCSVAKDILLLTSCLVSINSV